MSTRIPSSFLEILKSRLDIVELIKAYVPLKKSGANSVGLCPFHQEKTPSFSVNSPKQIYYCFGCGQRGDVVQFLMDYEGIGFLEAIEKLAQKVGLSVPETGHGHTQGDNLQLYYDLLEKSTELYQQQLKVHPQGALAIRYLKSRGLTGQIAKHFRLGFAPDAWHFLEKNLDLPQQTTQNLKTNLIKVGMIVENAPGKHYDRFRNRIVFPIRNRHGKVVGFGARVLGEGHPKYLNSPETMLFHKSQEIYGLYEAKKANRNLSTLIVVEGYLDVLSLTQYGITNSVATLGTAFNATHFNKLSRQAKRLIFCFDGDKAGKLAAWRALEICLPLLKTEYKILFCFLPENLDPDVYVRSKGSEAFLACLEQAMPLSEYLLDSLVRRVDLKETHDRAKLVEISKSYITQIPDEVLKTLLYQRLGDLVGLDPSVFTKQYFARKKYYPQKPTVFIPKALPPVSLAKKAIALLMTHRKLLEGVGEMTLLEESQETELNLFCRIVAKLKKSPTIDPQSMVQAFSLEDQRCLVDEKLSAIANQVPEGTVEQEFRAILKTLRDTARKQRIESLLKVSKNGKLSDQQKETLRQLFTQIKETSE